MTTKVARRLVVVLIAALLVCVNFAAGQKQSQPPPATSTPAPAASSPATTTSAPVTAPQAVALADIPLQTDELNRKLTEMKSKIPDKAAIAEVESSIESRQEKIEARIKETRETLSGNPSFLEIRDERRYWQSHETLDSGDRAKLKRWSADLQQYLRDLSSQETIWNATLKEYSSVSGVENVTDSVRQNLAQIAAVKSLIVSSVNSIATIQTRVSQLEAEVTQVEEQIERTASNYQVKVLSRDSYPLWAVGLRKSGGEIKHVLSRTVRRSASASADFFKNVIPDLILISVLFGFGLAVVFQLRRQLRKSPTPAADLRIAIRMLNRPVAVAIFTTFPILIVQARQAPLGVTGLILLLFLIPLFRLLPVVLDRPRGPALYITIIFFVLNGLVDLSKIDAVSKRDLVVGFTLVSIGVFSWLFRKVASMEKTAVPRLLLPVVGCVLAILTVALIGNVLGFFILSEILRETTFYSTYLALVIFTAVRVATLLLAAILCIPRISQLAAVTNNRGGIQRWVSRILGLLGFLFWLSFTSEMLTIKYPIGQFLKEILEIRLPFKAVPFSIGDLLNFILVMLVGVLLSRAMRAFLRHDVLPRFRLARGVPGLLAGSLYYLLLFIFFLLAAAAMGINLDKFTLLTGAVGVGIGFGLQNLVNNFASGLILQFERPIYAGDILEVGGVAGEVKHIGLRATTIRTAQGAEVVIPNATLVSGQLTNWTLSEPTRRVDIPVGVAYGSDPQKVIDLLLSVVKSNEKVLKEPEPVAVFLGFGESALNFQVMFWADNSIQYFLRSDIAIALNNALNAAGFEIPFPQRDLHIRSTVETPKENVESREAEGEPESKARSASTPLLGESAEARPYRDRLGVR
jgi:potassium efflux system protein